MNDLKILKQTLKFIVPYKFKFIISFILMIISIMLNTIQPYLFGKSIDFLANKNKNGFISVFIAIFTLFITNLVISLIQKFIMTSLASRIEIDVRELVFSSLINLNISLFERSEKGEYITKLDSDIQAITIILTQKITIFIDILSVLFIGFVLFKISWILTLILISLFPTTLIIFNLYGKKIRIKEYELKKNKDSYYTFLEEILNGFKTIKILNSEGYITKIYSKIINDLYRIGIKKMNFNTTATGLAQFGNYISYMTILIVGAYQIFSGNLTLGGLVTFNSYSSSFTNSLVKITHLNSELQESLVSLKRIFELINQIPLQMDAKPTIQYKNNPTKTAFKIENVSFRYYESGDLILKRINFDVPSNKITAIIGRSGCGKTTLLNLLMGLYDNYEGNIYLGENIISKLSRNYLAKRITFVTQENYLFSLTIRENLLLAKPNATDLDLINACKRTNIYNEISNLPFGLDTKIGFHGIELSAGQKQRLAVARALLTDADIFLFDEITSSLDDESEKYMKKIIKTLSKKHTVIIVSHRFTTINDADKFIIIKEGEIVSEKDNFESINFFQGNENCN